LQPLALDPEIVEQWRCRPGGQVAKQLGGKEAERDPVAAIAIRSKNAFRAGDGADQRQAIAACIERAGPAEFACRPRPPPRPRIKRRASRISAMIKP
jgi:hypothetical protein